jgi:hypothetical protein
MTLPSTGIVSDPSTQQNLENLRKQFPVTGANVATATIADTNLASPNNSVYRTLLTAQTTIGQDAVAGTYLFLPGYHTATNYTSSPSGVGDLIGSATTMAILQLVAADYTVAGKSTKLRVRAQVSVNSTAPAITFTTGLYPVTVAGAADILIPTLGTVVAGTTVAIASPPLDTITSGASTDATFPTDGAFAFGVVTSGTIANNSAVQVSAQLQMRHT